MEFEDEVPLPAGQIWFLSVYSGVKNSQGDLLGVQVMSYDVTARKQQERLAAIGQLAAGIAHDFNNILGVILLYAQLMYESSSLSENDRERLQTINLQSNRAAQLVRQILDFSRQSLLETQPLDLLPFLKEEIKLWQRALPEHIEMNLIHNGDTFFVAGDPARLQQALMNLALNARDAMPGGGMLSLQLDLLSVTNQQPAPLPQMEAGEWIQLQIILHRLSADIELPLGQGESILVVEDDQLLCAAMVETLSSWGYQVSAAQNGLAALDILQRQSVALVVSDVVMPRMGGIEMVKAMRRQGIQVPVIFLSGHLPEDAAAQMEEYAFKTLAKPFDQLTLARLVAQAIAEG